MAKHADETAYSGNLGTYVQNWKPGRLCPMYIRVLAFAPVLCDVRTYVEGEASVPRVREWGGLVRWPSLRYLFYEYYYVRSMEEC